MKNVNIEFDYSRNKLEKSNIIVNNYNYSPLLSKKSLPSISNFKIISPKNKKALINSSSSLTLLPKKQFKSNFIKLSPESNTFTKNQQYIHNKKMLLETLKESNNNLSFSNLKNDIRKKVVLSHNTGIIEKQKNRIMIITKKNLSHMITKRSTDMLNKEETTNNNPFQIVLPQKKVLEHKYIPSLLYRKEINKIPVQPQIPIMSNNQFASFSEQTRYSKFIESLLKLSNMINLDSHNSFKYLKEFLYSNGIYDKEFYTNKYLVNLTNYLRGDFIRTIDPNKPLRDILIDALILGKQLNQQKHTTYISPFLLVNNKVSSSKREREAEDKVDRYEIFKLEQQKRMYEMKEIGENIINIKEKLEDELAKMTKNESPVVQNENTNYVSNFYITMGDKKEIIQINTNKELGINFELIKKSKKITEFANLEKIKEKMQPNNIQ